MTVIADGSAITVLVQETPAIQVVIEDDPITEVRLIAETGPAGLSAYEIALNHGFVGTEEEWYAAYDVQAALDAAVEAEDSAAAALASETAAGISETNAEDSALAAAGSASTATTQAGIATTQAGIIVGSVDDAVASALLASRWAEEAENVIVVSGQYSALHHATKAAASAVTAAAAALAAAGDADDAAASAASAAGAVSTALLDYYTSAEVDSLLSGLSTDHGALSGLADDDHTQYHTDARGDARYSQLGHTHDDRYYTDAEVDALLAGLSSDHGALTGLGDDDHTQYHNDARGDARYSLLAHAHDHGALTGLSDDDHSAIYPGINQTETISGAWDFTSAGIGASFGIDGRYTALSGGADFGATIWALDSGYHGTTAGVDGGVPSYGIAWLRGTHANALSGGEGLYGYVASTNIFAITNTRAYFAQEIYPSGQTTGNLTSIGAVGGGYGSVGVSGAESGGYAGVNVGGRLALMNNGSTTSGLYNDTNNHWFLMCVENSEMYLYTAGTQIARTDAEGLLKVGEGNFIHHTTDYGAGGLTISTSAASGGSNGDIWFRY